MSQINVYNLNYIELTKYKNPKSIEKSVTFYGTNADMLNWIKRLREKYDGKEYFIDVMFKEYGLNEVRLV